MGFPDIFKRLTKSHGTKRINTKRTKSIFRPTPLRLASIIFPFPSQGTAGMGLKQVGMGFPLNGFTPDAVNSAAIEHTGY